MKNIRLLALLLFLSGTSTLFAQKNAQEWAAKAELAYEKNLKLLYYTQAWYADKTNAKYLYCMAQVKYDLGRYAEALNDLDSVLLKKPRGCEGVSLLHLHGRCQLRLQKPEEALKDWGRVLKECPNDVNARVLYAAYYLDQSDYENCLKYALEAAKLDPKNDEALLLQAKVALAKTQWDEAIGLATRAVDLNGVFKRPALYLRGEAKRRQGKLDEALIDLGPLTDPDALYATGLIYMAKGDYDNARKKFEAAIGQRPNFPEAEEGRAEALRKLGNTYKPQSGPLVDKWQNYEGPKFLGCVDFKNTGKSLKQTYLPLSFSGAPLPKSVDLSFQMPVVRNQGATLRCVSYTLGYLCSYFEKMETGKSVVFAPSFLYNQGNACFMGQQQRVSSQQLKQYCTNGGGMSIDYALQLLQTKGNCPEDKMEVGPEDDFRIKPGQKAQRAAVKYQILRYSQITDLLGIKASLNAKNPVVMGILVDEYFQKSYQGEVWDGPKASIGKHAMLVVGYDDAKSAVKVINSWGREWGDHGYAWISYQCIEDFLTASKGLKAEDGLPIEFYTAKDAQNAQEYDEWEEEKDPQDQQREVNVRPTPPNPNNAPPPSPNNAPPQNNEEGGLFDQLMRMILQGGDYYNSYARVGLTSVVHNQFCSGNGMYIYGDANVPAYAGYSCQVVITFYNAYTGLPVGSLNPYFTTYTGQVATGTPTISLPQTGMSNTWYACVPYAAFNIGFGRTDLYGIPVLYVDNYGIAQGPRFDFFIVK